MERSDFYFIAGEKSGDEHGSRLMERLKELYPNLSARGIGGPKMEREGLLSIAPFEDFQVMGFTDVILALPRLVPHFYKIANQILTDCPKGVIFIDYPGFNLRLAKYLRKKGYQGKLVHYIAPSVWAWGKKRIQTMRQTLDLLLTIYPFEPQYFNGLKTVYVGNPLVEEPFLNRERKDVLALFPGSRLKEIRRNLPLQIEAAKLLNKEEVAISVSHSSFEEPIRKLLENVPLTYRLIPESDRHELMETASIALAKSGTVTLELALRGCPTVVLYQLTRLNYFLARYIFRISLPYYSLPNILLNELLFPEHYHVKIDPKDLAEALKKQEERSDIGVKVELLKEILTKKAASSEAAQEIQKLCF